MKAKDLTSKERELNINSTIYQFPDEYIRQALKVIEGDSPFFQSQRIIEGMHDLIVHDEEIAQETREIYEMFYNTFLFYSTLVKLALGYDM